MGGGAFHVGSDTTGDVCGLFFANVFDTLRRDTDYEAAGRVLLSLWDEGAGGHYGAPPISQPCTIALWPTTHSSPTMAW